MNRTRPMPVGAAAWLVRPALLCLVAVAALGGCDDGLPPDPPDERPATSCDTPGMGCRCESDAMPVGCTPGDGGEASTDAEGNLVCEEGTRYCRNGRWSGCEHVQSFIATGGAPLSALVDQVATHPRCSDCDRSCFFVIDPLVTTDPLDASFATNVEYGSEGGIRVEAMGPGAPPTPVQGDFPDGALYMSIFVGMTSSVSYATLHRPGNVDVYFLVDMSANSGQAWQELDFRFDQGTYFDPNAPCASGAPDQVDGGIAGGIQCMASSAAFGSGLLRDIPFAPYGGVGAIAFTQTTFEQHQAIDVDAAATKASFGDFGGPQDAGDAPGSQIPALHIVATGVGLEAGLARQSVPDGPGCTGNDFGYPCFRENSDAIVVMVTDNPGHNASPASGYDYATADLQIRLGTTSVLTTIPATNDDAASAYRLADDVAPILQTFSGNSSTLTSQILASAVGCGAEQQASDAVFTFGVDAGTDPTVSVLLSTEGTLFDTALSIHDGPPLLLSVLPTLDDSNERFDTSEALGDVTGTLYRVSGDTTLPSNGAANMVNDYQGSLIGDGCDPNSRAPDAVYSFNVNSAGGDVELDVSLEMGNRNAALVIYAEGDIPAQWPLHTTQLTATNNSSVTTGAYVIPTGEGNEYITITGDTSWAAIGSDYNNNVLGNYCNATNSTKDVIFRLDLPEDATMRFDTEGSTFDTHLSLHDASPLTKTGSAVVHLAANTHMNMNVDADSAYQPVLAVNDLSQTWTGDTTGMGANVGAGGCALDTACGDAVYKIVVERRTSVRIEVEGTGFEPGFLITRAPPTEAQGGFPALAAGDDHTCSVSGGNVYCWGSNSAGQIGNGGTIGNNFPDAEAVSIPADVSQIAAGSSHSCAVTVDGDIYCWGEGDDGQLGNGASADSDVPVKVSDIGGGLTHGEAVQVGCGAAHTCALLSTGAVVCWGDNAVDQLGNGGSPSASNTPLAVSGGVVFAQLAVNNNQACGVEQSDRTVYCWGEGVDGKQGDGSDTDNDAPARVGTLGGADHVMVGKQHACAVMRSGKVYCWGNGADGRLGQDTDFANYNSPVVVTTAAGGDPLSDAGLGWAAGDAHTCVTSLAGFVMCWGDNSFGQLGDGGSADSGLPVGVRDILTARQVVSSHNHSCALLQDGTARCWGHGGYKLGTGSTANANQSQPMHPGSGANVDFGDGSIDSGLDSGESIACRSGTQPPEPFCVRDFNTAQNKAYYFCHEAQRTWAEAGMACEAVGMELASPDANGEADYLVAGFNGTGGRTWIGVKRNTDEDWLKTDATLNFETIQGDQIWVTTTIKGDDSPFSTTGYFTGPASSELNNSVWPLDVGATWEGLDEPNSNWGYNCVSVAEDGGWRSEQCSTVEDPGTCGYLGVLCALDYLVDYVVGILTDILPSLADPEDVVTANGGRFASPLVSAGPQLPYVCEATESFTDVVLDPGEYWVTVKGIDDGVDNACEGEYALTISDLGSASGGFLICDSNDVLETWDAVLEEYLTAGTYYIVVKEKFSGNSGPYNLTVRNVSAMPDSTPIACDENTGFGEPARATFTASPGTTYYALVKGDRPNDAGPYTLNVAPATSSTFLGCDDNSGPTGGSELTVDLPTGEYYAVLKGRSSGASGSGDYKLTVGGVSPVVSTFDVPSYDETIAALDAEGIRVATILWCSGGGNCDDASAQWTQLATDTGGVMRMAVTASDIPSEVVMAVSALESLDSVTATLVSPMPVPGFENVTVSTVPDANNLCTGMGAAQWTDCQPGATPAFMVEMLHPVATPIPPANTSTGAFEYTLIIEGTRDGETLLLESIPLFVFPEGSAPADTFSGGSYHQSFDSRGCDALQEGDLANFRASWDMLTYQALVLPGTSLTFQVCTADSLEDLDGCEVGADDVSGYFRTLTVTAGSGGGDKCDDDSDCPDGYCSELSGVCNYVEGNTCTEDIQCPGAATGSCRTNGPSVADIGNTCRVFDRVAVPSAALASGNYRPFMRLKAELVGSPNGTRSPSLYQWMMQYHCVQPD